MTSFEISRGHLVTLHGLVTALALLAYVITSHLAQQRRQPSAAIAWIFFILLAPYLALPAFLAFGVRKRRVGRPLASPEACVPKGQWVTDTCLALGQPGPAAYRDLALHQDGRQSLEVLFEVIAQARTSIDVCTFILGRDGCGREVVARLADRARAGVRVRVLVDGLGSLMGGHPDLGDLRAAGGACTVFMPPVRTLLNRRANLRNHRKFVLADAGQPSGRVWCGGRNLAAEYFMAVDGRRAWQDLTFDMGGPVLRQLASLFERDWNYANRRAPPAPRPAQASVEAQPEGAPCASLVASGPDESDDTLYSLLLMAVYRAQGRIAIATPYFIPDADLLLALRMAARRGIRVDVLVPETSNHPMSDFVRGRAFRALEDAGARVWLAPGMLHAKLAVVDDVLALAGSANLDSRSLFLNYELMVAFQATADVRRFGAWFERERLSARAFTGSKPGLLRDLADGMVLWLAFQI